MNATLNHGLARSAARFPATKCFAQGQDIAPRIARCPSRIGKDGKPVVHSHAGDDWKMPRLRASAPRHRVIQTEWPAKPWLYICDPTTGEVRYEKSASRRRRNQDTLLQAHGRNGGGDLLYGAERLADAEKSNQSLSLRARMVDRLRELGAVAVSADSGFASKWLPAHADLLRGLKSSCGRIAMHQARNMLRAQQGASRIPQRASSYHPFGPQNGTKGRDAAIAWKRRGSPRTRGRRRGS